MTISYDPAKGMVYVIEAGPLYQSLICTTALKWNRQRRQLEGAATAETLDTLAMFQKLPKDAEAERQRLRKQRMMIEAMRNDADPKPIIKPPVKVEMFKHQIRGFNMALTVFEGVV